MQLDELPSAVDERVVRQVYAALVVDHAVEHPFGQLGDPVIDQHERIESGVRDSADGDFSQPGSAQVQVHELGKCADIGYHINRITEQVQHHQFVQ
ncbi:hypothetical protein D3C84_763030 [compost metagenome]